MKKHFLAYFIMALIGFGLYSCAPSDEKVQREAQSALTAVQPELKVLVKNGIATVVGTVVSEEAKAEAEEVVKNVPSVKSVVSEIVVEQPVVVNPDEELQKIIAASLDVAGFKDIVVAVKDSAVTLTGEVKRADKQKVLQIVNNIKPKKVDDQLKVK